MEQRKQARSVIRIIIAFQVGSGGPRIDAMCGDISLGGAFIETLTTAPFGAAIRVFIRLPGLAEESAIDGIVRWTKPTGMGVQFGVMGARQTRALTQLLSGLLCE